MEQTCTDPLPSHEASIAPSLEALRAKHRETARYSIYRHRLADDGYNRVQEPLDYTGLEWTEVETICGKLNREAREAAGNPSDSWGLTQYYPKLETPLPPRFGTTPAVGTINPKRLEE